MKAPPNYLKTELRAAVRARLKNLSAAERAIASIRGCSLLERQDVWKKAHSILFFASLLDELNIWPLVTDALAAKKIVALPRFVPEASGYISCEIHDPEKDLFAGRFGVREPADHCIPIELNRLDLILVPGVAFDLCGRRLGRGKGFYDQLLALVRGKTCGVAFDEQIVTEVPTEPHDLPVNCILTPTRWIEV